MTKHTTALLGPYNPIEYEIKDTPKSSRMKTYSRDRDLVSENTTSRLRFNFVPVFLTLSLNQFQPVPFGWRDICQGMHPCNYESHP